MGNPFDQFDVPIPSNIEKNVFDQFDKFKLDPGKVSDLTGKGTPAKPKELEWADVPAKALLNAPGSAARFAGDLIHPLLHPIQTAETFYDIGKGLVSKTRGLFPGQDPEQAAEDEATINAVGQFFADRYGSMDALKKSLAEDPVGVMADVSAVLAGGSLAAGRVPGTVGRIAEKAGRVATEINPVTPVMRTGAKVLTAPLALSTGVSPKTLDLAFKAGEKENKVFGRQLSGRGDINEPIDLADKALSKITQRRGAEYEKGMAPIKGTTEQVDFGPVNRSLKSSRDMVTFEGLSVDDAALKTLDELESKILEWQTQPPKTVNGKLIWPTETIEGADALKKAIGAIKDTTEEGSLSRKVANNVYNTLRDSILKQHPDYAKVMKGYADASDELKELRKTFSMGEKATDDTKLRKLQSILRDNVNTNYGAREKLSKVLTKEEPDLPYSIAGQSLHSLTPKGLGRAIGGIELLSLLTHFDPRLLGALLTTSPRLMGEGMRGLGRLTRYATKPVGLGAYQLGRFMDDEVEAGP